MAISTHELYWAAGFLEGEGSFLAQGRGRRSFRVYACQVQEEPLLRLQRLVGGRLLCRHRLKGVRNNQPVHEWYLDTDKSVQLAMTLYSLMSPKRQEQIASCLNNWCNTRIIRKPGTTICIKGHPIEGWNAMPMATGVVCRLCHNARKLKYHRRKRAELLTHSEGGLP